MIDSVKYEKNRMKLLMLYSNDKTLSENISIISEQIPEDRFVSQQDKELLKKGEEESIENKKIEEKNKYPNYCKYPDKAVLPKRQEAGTEGEKALIPGFCYYPTPNNSGIYIPNFAYISFWNMTKIRYAVNERLKKDSESDYDTLISNFVNIFPVDTVASFVINDKKYTSWITFDSGTGLWKFKGYYLEGTNQPYVQPEWKEKVPRTKYQKFVDEWGFLVQLGTTAAIIISGTLTGGATWVLALEILTELGIGTAIAYRDLEKGNNISAAFSFVLSFLPMVRLLPQFRGISNELIKELSDDIIKSGLNKSSSARDYKKFYESLTLDKQKLISKILTTDDISKQNLIKNLESSLKNDLPKLVIKDIQNTISKHPDQLVRLKAFEKLWAKEMAIGGTALATNVFFQLFLSGKLDNQDKKILQQLYYIVPDDLKKELTYNLLSNPNTIKKTLNHPQIQEVIKKPEELGKKIAQKMLDKYLRTKIKKAVTDSGGQWTNLDETDKQN